MIQRIQTILLVLAAGAQTALFFLPFATSTETIQGVFTDGKYTIMDDVLLEVLAAAGVLFSLIAIFLYRNRTRQTQLCYMVSILNILLLALVFIHLRHEYSTGMGPAVTWGWFMPGVALIFIAYAIYFISKDDKLVKSLDRLR